MQLQDFLTQIKDRKVKGKAILFAVQRCIAEGGELVPLYAPYLESAETYLDFLENVYQDGSVLMDDVWGYACRLLHPHDALRPFKPIARENGVSVKAGTVDFPGADGLVPVRAPFERDEVDVLVFEDGSLNELALKPAGKLAGDFTAAGVRINGKLSIYHGEDGELVLMPWIIDADGARPKARELSVARARNSAKPKSGNC